MGSLTIEEYFKGLADRTRLRILNLLLTRELCGCDIQYVLDANQSNVSRHLTYLKRAGLVTDRREGYRVFYRLTEDRDAGLPLLTDYLRTAFRNEKTFTKDLLKLREAIRDGECTVSEVRLVTARSGRNQASSSAGR